MKIFTILAFAFSLFSLAAPAEARLHKRPLPSPQASFCNPADIMRPCDPMQFLFGIKSINVDMKREGRRGRIERVASSGAGRVIGGRPAGCPSRFCGCSASLRLFGRIVPSLNLAANWLRFPRTAPAPRMVAARRGHVFVLEHHIAGNVWMVHDGNSGGRKTRLHPRSIAGYTVVDPSGAA